MKTLVTFALGAVVGALVAVLAMVVFIDDQATTAAPPEAEQLTTADCLVLIPESVVDTLGWQLGGVAAENTGRCERFGDDGSVTVGDLAVVVTGDDRAESAEKEYDERCSALFRGEATPDLDVDWLPEGTVACARLLPSSQDMGLAELFLLTDGNGVVQIRVVALTAIEDVSVRTAFMQLVQAADSRW